MADSLGEALLALVLLVIGLLALADRRPIAAFLAQFMIGGRRPDDDPESLPARVGSRWFVTVFGVAFVIMPMLRAERPAPGHRNHVRACF